MARSDAPLVRPKSVGIVASATFTPAAAAYGNLDIIDVAKEFAFTFADDGETIPPGSLIKITGCNIRNDVTSVPAGMTSSQLALYNVTPPSAQADNAAWTLAAADLSAYLDTLTLGTLVDAGASLFIATHGLDKTFKLLTSSLWGRYITTVGFTAAAVAHTVQLFGVVL